MEWGQQNLYRITDGRQLSIIKLQAPSRAVHSSVMLCCCDHIGWNTLKLISWLISLGCSLFADPNAMDLLQREHPKILAGIGVGYGKSGVQYTTALISLKWGKTGPTLLLRTNRKSHLHFRLVPKSVTLSDLEVSLCTLFKNTCSVALLFF